ncbi:Clarin-3, partial [Ophiophagus hannah]
MPSRRKTLMFASAFFTSLCSFVIVCVMLATKNWVSSDLTNLKEKSNMRLIITYGLFQGVCSDVSPGISSPHTNFQGICCLLNLILFAVNVEVNKLSAELAITHCIVFTGFEQSNSYGYSYWIMLLIIALNATTIIIIVFYQQAKYSEKKERERPLDSAPKDGILF